MLATICDAHPKGQQLCASSGLLAVLLKWLRSLLPSLMAGGAQPLVRWLCLALGKMCDGAPDIAALAVGGRSDPGCVGWLERVAG